MESQIMLPLLTVQVVPLLVIVLSALAVLVGSGFIVFYGVQSLKQASLLENPIPLRRFGLFDGQPVALIGRPQEAEYVDYNQSYECAWMQIEWQEYIRHGKNRGWRTMSRDTMKYDFYLEDEEGNKVLVINDATEVHGRINLKGDGTGNHRKNLSYLPFNTEMTVIGKAVAGQSANSYSLVKDEKVGMLLSAVSARKQAQREKMKGVLSVAGTAIAWLAFGAYLLVNLAG
ncbi:MAG: hypothetical protein P1V97_36355 [Planctomycetota bacterium]|nr:hypothetical protein [Planctomycetota bacterium]